MDPADPAASAPLVARTPVRRQNASKLSHLIARELRGMIVRGELVPGQALPSESDLLRTFEVSRDTLREALRILESESLIRVRRGRRGGAVVEQPHRRSVTRHVALLLQVQGATVSEVQEARLVIEPLAAARLAEMPPDAVDTLRELHAAEERQLDDPQSSVSTHAAFDQAVLELSGNQTIGLLSSVFRDLIAGQAFRSGMLQRRSPATETLTALQAEFIEAIAHGDAHRAHDTWAEYLTETAKRLAQEMSDDRFQVAPVWRALRDGAGDGSASDKMAAAIATEIRIRIADGNLRSGDQLAPLPELAAEFGVSRPTIRECLRVLEVEALVDLRTGSRTGATILEPSAETAGQLAGIVLATAQTRMADVTEARRLVEPSVMELVAGKIDAEALARLSARLTEVESVVQDTPVFIEYFEDLGREALFAAQNPAISVATEMMHWVIVRCRPDLTIRALSLPQVVESNRRSCRSFARFLSAAESGDVKRAGQAWAEHLDEIAPFFRSFGDRLIGDLFD